MDWTTRMAISATRSPTTSSATAQASLGLALPMLAACSSPAVRPPPAGTAAAGVPADLVVVDVGPAVYEPVAGHAPEPGLAARCQAWSLSADDVARFFHASREYPDGTHDAFYALPCSIHGTLRADGVTWAYQINAAATATWTSAGITRTFGCSAAACSPLVLLRPDDNAGE
jgi:hypothetical protein